MKTKVYQLFLKNERCYFKKIGTVTGIINDPDVVWDLTNHGCWGNKRKSGITRDGVIKYYPTKYDHGYTNDDICFRFRDSWWCPKSVGWKEVKSKGEAVKYIREHSYWVKDWKGKIIT